MPHDAPTLHRRLPRQRSTWALKLHPVVITANLGTTAVSLTDDQVGQFLAALAVYRR